MRQVKDPAPSRIAYRLNRLMLTPGVRAFLRIGLPLLVAFFVGMAWFGDPDRRQALADRVAEVRRQIEERPEFMVQLMEIETASDAVAAEIRGHLQLDLPSSSFDLDLEAIRVAVETLAPVRTAEVRIRSGGVLEVRAEERLPVVLWRGPDELVLLDREAVVVAQAASRVDHPDLPLIAGEGAERRIDEALALMDAARPIAGRVRGLVRIGERRWDVALDREQRIMLPEAKAVLTLEKIIALDDAQDLLARDIAAVDFRNPRRPVLRLTDAAAAALHETGWTERLTR